MLLSKNQSALLAFGQILAALLLSSHYDQEEFNLCSWIVAFEHLLAANQKFCGDNHNQFYQAFMYIVKHQNFS